MPNEDISYKGRISYEIHQFDQSIQLRWAKRKIISVQDAERMLDLLDSISQEIKTGIANSLREENL